MTALVIYESLPKGVRLGIERRVLARVGAGHWVDAPEDTADALTLADALGGNDNHPALRDELRTWWHERATTDEILARIDAADVNERARELAIMLCAEACAHLSSDSRVVECRRVRLAWARGEATDEQRFAAIQKAVEVIDGATVKAAESSAARAHTQHSAVDAQWPVTWSLAWRYANVSPGESLEPWRAAKDAAHAAFASPLRALYPDPCAIEVGVGLARWDVAIVEAHTTLRQAVTR